MSKITVDGNTAAASMAYKVSQLAAIYPITPSSTMAELMDSMSAQGEKNIFGDTVKVVEMQSEGGASGTIHGALSAGALATTFTSSQGLLLMIPNMYKIAGELLPTVFHVSARSIATHALSIFGDHSDVMAVRQTGFAMLASSNVQEAQDMALVSHIATLKSSVPFLHFFDGFRTSHEINTIDQIDDTTIKAMYPYDKLNEFRSRALSSAHPHQQGTSQTPDVFFTNREACNTYYNNVPSIINDVFDKLYTLTGRRYRLFDYYGSKNAEYVIVSMGSSTDTIIETIDYLRKTKGLNIGCVKVHLYRPFSIKHFVDVLPKSVKKIAVLDRTKEPGASGEPLYLDVVNAINESNRNIDVVGGRYGLGSFEFTPTMVYAVVKNLMLTRPKNHFTVGINDDVTNTSLKLNEQIVIENKETACKFYGFGGDGTVSANKSSIKIISNIAHLNGQAYFEYDSKKSGNATICHLRFGKNKIIGSYLLDNIDFVACHSQTYLTKFNLTKGLKNGGILLINTGYGLKELDRIMPATLKKDIANKKINVYTIDATSLAAEIGLNNKINLIMQAAFFKLIKIIPISVAVEEMKKFAKISYGSKGDDVLQKNYLAIEEGTKYINKIDVPSSWKNAVDTIKKQKTDPYYTDFIRPIQNLDGSSLPVSKFDPRGYIRTNTSNLEKRGTTEFLPCWKSENCIQCNLCALSCPHAAIRPYLLKDVKNAPKDFVTLDAMREPDKRFKIQVSPLDCTGCGVCANVCPAKQKALEMQRVNALLDVEKTNYDYITKQNAVQSDVFDSSTIKGSQFNKPYFEFSGACAGCGETPYIKLISQLFGDRMIIANATGCSSIYGGSFPSCPYAKDSTGRGVAWANSLFEDNAEFGLGIKLGVELKNQKLKSLLQNCKNVKVKNIFKKYLNSDIAEQKQLSDKLKSVIDSENIENKQEILSVIDSMVDQSIWIVGGDGWAYDIGYGGLDHVLNSKENINILVLDTEVYSNTGGQASKATPMGAVAKFASSGKKTRKKDLALMATLYKDVYVAKVSMGANPNQLLKALKEAESYNGVSLIVAYAPCTAHGIDMSKTQEEMKKAVSSGYWQLFRYDPRLREQNKNPFVLDSQPTTDFMDFIKGENRFRSLLKINKNADQIFKQAQQDAMDTYNTYKTLSEQK